MHRTVAAPMSRQKIRRIAARLRELINISPQEPFPVMEFIELVLPQVEPGFTYEIVDVQSMGNCYALTFPNKKKMRIREDVYEDALNGVGRARFTLAHELGHLFMHDNSRVALARADCAIPSFKDPEWQANAFAADLLMPLTGIADLGVNEIVERYQVSYQAAEIQHNQVKKQRVGWA